MKKLILIPVIALGMLSAFAQNSKINTASNYLAQGDLGKAREAIDDAVQNEKTMHSAKAWMYRGRIYNLINMDTTGKFSSLPEDPLAIALTSLMTAAAQEDAKNYKKEIADELFTTYNFYFARGSNDYNAGHYGEALENFKKAGKANDLEDSLDAKAALDTGVIFNIGLMAERTKQPGDAIAAYQRLVDMHYHEAYVYSQLSQLYLQEGDTAKALSVIDTGRTYYPKNKDIMVAELNFYLTQNKLDVLVDKLQQAIDEDPENPELYFVMGTTEGNLIQLDSVNSDAHFDKAVAAYKKVIALNPTSFDANLNLGALYYNTAIGLNKILNNLPYDQDEKFHQLEDQRNALYQKALPYFEAAHNIDPKDIPIIQSLKEIYARLGDVDKANAMKQLLDQLQQ